MGKSEADPSDNESNMVNKDKTDNFSEMIFTKRQQQGSSSPRSQNDMQTPNKNTIVFKPFKVDNTTR
jgi:hypothetical protein